MSINWFTFFAQIVNFLILLFLLRRFLYGPLMQAMARRQELLSAEFAAAEARAAEAAAAAEQARAQQKELADQRAELLAQAAQEVDARRRTMILEARAEVEEMQSRWYHAVEQERAAMMQNLRLRLGEQVTRLTEQTLADLANADLERAMVEKMVQQITELAQEDRNPDQEPMPLSPQPIQVRSTFPLDAELQNQVRAALAAISRDQAPPDIEFGIDDKLLCGIEIELPFRRVGWNLRDHMQGLESELEEALSAHTLAAVPTPEREAISNEFLPG